MAYQSVFYNTELPDFLIDEIISQFDKNLELNDSKLSTGSVDKKLRNCKNGYFDTDNWISSYIWYFVDKANKSNFMYDITNIDGETISYIKYTEGEFYNWHCDTTIDEYFNLTQPGHCKSRLEYVNEKIGIDYELTRKLSFSIQLSDPNEYEGGDLQFMTDSGALYQSPKEKGTIVIFDSRARHRVRKVKSGVRKSLVGWVVGPRWK